MVPFMLCVMTLVFWAIALWLAYEFKKACHNNYLTKDRLMNPLGPVTLLIGFIGWTVGVCILGGLAPAVIVVLAIVSGVACLVSVFLLASGALVGFDA